MFGFFFGLIVGFLGMWFFGGQSSSEIKQRVREMGGSAQRAMPRASPEVKTATERQRSAS